MATFTRDFMAVCARHGTDATLILQLVQWVASTGRLKTIHGYEGDPDIQQAYLWPIGAEVDPAPIGSDRALSAFALRPGRGVDLSYWMARMPVSISDRLSSLGQDSAVGPDGTIGPSSGFALWTPLDGPTTVVHVTTPGAFAAPIGTVKDFLRALSLPIKSLSTALSTGQPEQALPNESYRKWLGSIGLAPADTLPEALPNLAQPEDDTFRAWLQANGYNDPYFISGTMPSIDPSW